MRPRRKYCIHRDYDGGACPEKQIRPEDAAREPANTEYCWEHRPVHQYDHDPACWSWPLPHVPDGADPWMVLANWQDDRCAICGRAEVGSVLDHDHQSGLARGWTCRTCNVQEGRSRRPLSRYARWRACPATAMLGLLLPYGGGWDNFDGQIDIWTGKTFLPDGAPDAHFWPHAVTCEIPPRASLSGVLTYQCDHPHKQWVLRATRLPMSDKAELILACLDGRRLPVDYV